MTTFGCANMSLSMVQGHFIPLRLQDSFQFPRGCGSMRRPERRDHDNLTNLQCNDEFGNNEGEDARGMLVLTSVGIPELKILLAEETNFMPTPYQPHTMLFNVVVHVHIYQSRWA